METPFAFCPPNVRTSASMDQDKKRFAWGLGLAWVPVLVAIVPGLINAFRGVSQEKATGLAAVAGGYAEFLATFGLVAFVVSQVVAIVLLARGIKREQWGRSMVAVVSIVCSVVILSVTAFMTYWLWHLRG
jgi:membrane-anchored protein YejM (alkaline phosphatase superfamily)